MPIKASSNYAAFAIVGLVDLCKERVDTWCNVFIMVNVFTLDRILSEFVKLDILCFTCFTLL